MKKVILIIIMAIIALCGGCATISKDERAEIATACKDDAACIVKKEAALVEQKEYERVAARELEEDQIRARIERCDSDSTRTLVYDGPSTVRSRRHRRQGEPVVIPRHARLMDYHCMSNREVREWLRRNLGGGLY